MCKNLLRALIITISFLPLPSLASNNIQPATIARVEQYLQKLTSLQANFMQSAPNGDISSGKFFLKRPGKMRWQYDAPTPILMVSDGSVMTYYDSELDQVTDLPIDDSLAGFLAQKDIKFNSKAIQIEEASQQNSIIRIRITQTDKKADGELTMEFSDSPLQLRNLILKDAQAQTTNISLSDAKFDLPLEDKLFVRPSNALKRKHG